MTKERREEVVLVALVVSVAIHIALMFLVRAQVMTRAGSGIAKTPRREPMRVVNRVQRPDPAKIEEILDLEPVKDAPPVQDVQRAEFEAPSAPQVQPEKSKVPESIIAKSAVPEIAPTKFVVCPVGLDVQEPVMPITKIETPEMKGDPVAAPEFTVGVPTVSRNIDLPAAPVVSAPPVGTVRMDTGRGAEGVKFTPASAVYEKVDEQVVAEEKTAVRGLVNATEAADLVKFVNVTMTATEADGWRYFKVMMVPRRNLQVVPKDVVLVIDGSGSIGKDRFSGCRRVSQKIMRSCMNTGDRFNLVVFRNAFSYAFRSWRECDAESFAAGDKWLALQTAHGRTDVFSTISSVLTLPRDPKRPLVALVVTDGDANMGVSDTAEILSKFTALNDGLVSVYMYGVKSSANRELIDVLTHGNRGESFVFEGWRWNTGEGMEELSERFRDPVLSDLRVIFSSGTKAEAYPLLLRNLYRGGTLEFAGRVPAGTKEISFALRGLNGASAYEGFFKLPFATAPSDPSVVALWRGEADIARKLGQDSGRRGFQVRGVSANEGRKTQ